MTKASFILPPAARPEAIATCRDSLLAQQPGNLEVLTFGVSGEAWGTRRGAPADARIVTVPGAGRDENLPTLLNHAVSVARGDVVFFVAECVEFAPRFLETWLHRLDAQPEGAWAYGRFYEPGTGAAARVRDVRTARSDFSEGSLIGPVRGMRRECLQVTGPYDTDLHYAFEYDMRLRILERFGPVRIDEPLYTVLPADEDATGAPGSAMAHYRCYVRPAGAGRARSYLDYTAAEEGEFRDACRRSLARRGALLEGPPRPFRCPHGSAAAEPVTVIIPLWNRQDYIGAALESVLRSRGCTFEIVVVDNGSSDRSVAIVEEYQRAGPVRLIRNHTNNVAEALNAGIRASTGKYVCQLDSDDLYTPDTLRMLVDHMERHPDCALGVSYYDCIGPDGNPLADRGVVRHLEYDRNNLMRTDGLGAARIWHRCVLEELGGFDTSLGNYAEDYDLQLKLTEQYDVLRIPEVLYHYRIGHKQPGETTGYVERHRKKTRAREAALERRRRLNADA